MIKKNIKLIIGIIIGAVISGTSVYAISMVARDVSYDNTTSGSPATNMQGAIDDLYDKANGSVKVPDTYSITLVTSAITTTSSERQGSATMTLPISEAIYGYTKIKMVSGTNVSTCKFNAGSGAQTLSAGTSVDLPQGYTNITLDLISTKTKQATCIIELSKD